MPADRRALPGNHEPRLARPGPGLVPRDATPDGGLICYYGAGELWSQRTLDRGDAVRIARAAQRVDLTWNGYTGPYSGLDNGLDVPDAAAVCRPDVVLLDIGLPDIDGLEVARRLRTEDAGLVVILISTRDAAYGSRVAGGLAAGYLPK